MNAKRICWYMFFLGLFFKTQVHLIGYIGASELVVVFIAPFVFMKEHAAMKKDGVMPIMHLAHMTIIGCVLSSLINGSSFAQFVRGFAQVYTTWASLVVGYYLLSRNIMSYRWYILGYFLSGILSMYFMQGAALTVGGADPISSKYGTEMIVNGAMFWQGRILPAINVPIQMFYLQCPYIYSVVAPIISGSLALYLSEGSGRSAFAVLGIASMLIALGGKTKRSLSRVQKWFWVVVVLGVVLAGGIKSAYSWAAGSGRLGDNAERKYRDQTQRGTDALSIIISGRTDFFIGLYACLQKPIVGYGPWPLDTEGYRAYFYTKYGTDDEIRNAVELYDKYAMKTIPAHSHLIGFWLEYGILALPFWLYIIWLMFRYFREDLDVYPSLFGWLALTIPSTLMGIMFTPYANRVGIPILIIALILIHERKRQSKRLDWRISYHG